MGILPFDGSNVTIWWDGRTDEPPKEADQPNKENKDCHTRVAFSFISFSNTIHEVNMLVSDSMHHDFVLPIVITLHGSPDRNQPVPKIAFIETIMYI